MISTLVITLAITLIAFTVIWLISLRMKDASIVDFYWGPGFAVIGWVAWWMSGGANTTTLILCCALTLWALRLTWHIAGRHGAEDARYRAMRDRHGASFASKSLWMIFWLQAIIQWIAASHVLVAVLAPAQPIMLLVWCGAALFIAGFVLEVMADRAIASFRSNPANSGKLLTTGLHARVRHPNYLGEIILQFGLGLMAFGLTQNPLAFVGPVLIAFLMVKVSGVPMLEAMFRTRPGYDAWAAKTGALWPKF
jgi:steroid 5-alpha reductase family enzyme